MEFNSHESAVNPFYTSQTIVEPDAPEKLSKRLVELPQAPITGSPVPHLTSLYHFNSTQYGNRSYPGNCGGNLIKTCCTFSSHGVFSIP